MLRAMPFSFPRGGWLISMFDVSMSICQFVIRIRQIPPLPEGRDTPDPRPEVGAWSSQLPLLLLCTSQPYVNNSKRLNHNRISWALNTILAKSRHQTSSSFNPLLRLP